MIKSQDILVLAALMGNGDENRSYAKIADKAVKDMLRAASRYARCHSERLTHRQVFGGLQEIIDGSRVRA